MLVIVLTQMHLALFNFMRLACSSPSEWHPFPPESAAKHKWRLALRNEYWESVQISYHSVMQHLNASALQLSFICKTQRNYLQCQELRDSFQTFVIYVLCLCHVKDHLN